MEVLKIKNLCKKYDNFYLNNVSFTIDKGKIMGFIGRNGAGKSTTFKSMLNFVHSDSGDIIFFGEKFNEKEFNIKQRIGFVSGGIDYYPKKKLSVITEVTKQFYKRWDEEAYKRYMKLFKLVEDKTPDELSAGMKIKYSLVLALSHNAELLILDEPTSGLDPISREELLDIFLDLANKGISILFSTHIISDIEKCADNITYIKNGQVLVSDDIREFISKYKVINIEKEDLKGELKKDIIGYRRCKNGYTALVEAKVADKNKLNAIEADLESIIVHFEKEEI